VCVCLSRECTQTSCRNADSKLFECVCDGQDVTHTIVVKSGLHFSNIGTKNEYHACAHLLCTAGSVSLYCNEQMNTVFICRLSRNIFPLSYTTPYIITKDTAKSHKTCSQVGCVASVLVHNSEL